MRETTIIIIGGGHAGIHAIQAIREAAMSVRLILIDRQPRHVRKVMLVKSVAENIDIEIPWGRMFSDGLTYIQGSVTVIQKRDKRIQYKDTDGVLHQMDYDVLVVAIGSVVQRPNSKQGGIALINLDTAEKIRQQWQSNLRKATVEMNTKERKRLLSVAIAGAGISGIETSAELVSAMKKEAKDLGLNPKEIKIYLVNARNQLFIEGPKRVGLKLEQALDRIGVKVLHDCKVLEAKDGLLKLTGEQSIPIGLCVWTLGLIPNPVLQSLGLPLTTKGQVNVDFSYRVKGTSGIYSIGDCAQIINPKSGQVDQMTCREGISQAARLGRVIFADLKNHLAPSHKANPKMYCFALGPEDGLVWVRKWGFNIIVTGKTGWKVRELTWDLASLVK